MKALRAFYYTVTFLASVAVLGVTGAQVYLHWDMVTGKVPFKLHHHHHHVKPDCCKPGNDCCKPGADCCK